MAYKTYPLNITTTVDNDFIEAIVDGAGLGIGYWATSARVDHDDDGNITAYTVTWPDGGYEQTKKITPRTLVHAVEQILKPGSDVKVADNVVGYLRSLDPGNIDSEVGDVVVQVACFGEIVFA